MEAIVIQCGGKKIWHTYPGAPRFFPAEAAYVGYLFRRLRSHAKDSGLPWYILSAKYGLIPSDTLIENYEETFRNPGPGVVQPEVLRAQATSIAATHQHITCLTSTFYSVAIRSAFDGLGVDLAFPVEGKPTFLMVQWVAQQKAGYKPDSENYARRLERFNETMRRKRQQLGFFSETAADEWLGWSAIGSKRH